MKSMRLLKRLYRKLINGITYWWWYIRIDTLEKRISYSYLQEFHKTDRNTLWYIAAKRNKVSDAIDYSFWKVYDLWGMDSLTNDEKDGF